MSCLPSGSWAKSKLVVYFTNFLRNQFACFMFVADGWTFYPKNEKARYVVSYFDVWRLGLMTADGRRLMFCFFPFFDILFTRRQQLLSCVVYRFNIYSHFIHLRCGLALNICVHGRNLGWERYLLASCFSLWSAHLRNCGTRRPIWLTRLIAQVGNDHFECPNRLFPPIEKKNYSGNWSYSEMTSEGIADLIFDKRCRLRLSFELRRPTLDAVLDLHTPCGESNCVL